MNQKLCIITGANTGIGKAAAIQIANQGHHVIMACRNPQKGQAALQDVKAEAPGQTVELMIVDMSLQSSINDFAQEFLAAHNRLDILIHNAAIFDITQKTAVRTPEGIESVWATNHLGPVLLTDRLWNALKASPQGRVITIASKGLIAKPLLKVDLNDPQYKQRGFSTENAYYQSKLAQIMFTHWLVGRSQGTQITANAIRVPAVRVDISKYAGLPTIMKKLYALKSKLSLSPEEMAEVYTYVALSDELDDVTGAYFDEKKQQVKPGKYTQDKDNIAALMNLTLSQLPTENFSS
jgi:NAD(P)-dependent dehydrogenase (short-subunit alcohol dehydrogenase family)